MSLRDYDKLTPRERREKAAPNDEVSDICPLCGRTAESLAMVNGIRIVGCPCRSPDQPAIAISGSLYEAMREKERGR